MLLKLTSCFSLLFIFNSLSVFAQGFDEVQKIVAFDRGVDDYYGKDVAISGDYAVVGSFSDDFGGVNPNMGSAYIYHREIDGTWAFVQKIFNSDQDDYDRFGWSVAIDGDLIVVGAYREDHNVLDGALLSNAGSAYIFERNDAGVWTQLQKIVASDRTAEDEFGVSVAIHNEVIVIGARHNSTDLLGANYSYHAGAAYIFERELGGSWTESTKIVASDRTGNSGIEWVDHEDWNWLFGSCVDVFEETVVVSSPFAMKGYVFEKEGDEWVEVQTISYPYQGGLDRTVELAIHENLIVVGGQTHDFDGFFPVEFVMNAGVIAIFEKQDDGTWLFTNKISASDRSAGDHFGYSVDIHGDYVVVGAHSENEDEFSDDTLENTGAIYVYRKVGDFWIEYDKSDASDRTPEDELGTSVAISENTIFSGAFNQDFGSEDLTYIENGGAVYVYQNNEDVDCPTVYNIQHENVCEGEFIVIDGEIIDETGIYYNYYTSVAGCDSVLVTFFSVESFFPTYLSAVMCDGIPIVVGDITYYEPGEYIDTLTTIHGCDSLIYMSLYEGIPVTDNTINFDGTNLDALSVEAMAFQWIKCDPYEIIEGAIYNTLFSPADGDYAVIAYAWDGCADTSDCLHVGEIDETGLEEIKTGVSLAVYPNPSNGQFSLTISELIGVNLLEIINELGQIVYSSELSELVTTINAEQLSTGLYLVKVSNGKEEIYHKIVVEK